MMGDIPAASFVIAVVVFFTLMVVDLVIFVDCMNGDLRTPFRTYDCTIKRNN